MDIERGEVQNPTTINLGQEIFPRYCILLACGAVTVLVCVMNKVSPFGKYGAKMHALMTCPCKTCALNRALAIQGAALLDRFI